jgi:hypothetical protein
MEFNSGFKGLTVLLTAVFIRAVSAAIVIVLNSSESAVYRTVNRCIN